MTDNILGGPFDDYQNYAMSYDSVESESHINGVTEDDDDFEDIEEELSEQHYDPSFDSITVNPLEQFSSIVESENTTHLNEFSSVTFAGPSITSTQGTYNKKRKGTPKRVSSTPTSSAGDKNSALLEFNRSNNNTELRSTRTNTNGIATHERNGFKRVSVKRYNDHVRVADKVTVTSQVSKDMKFSPINLQKQLATAYKKIDLLKKENATLLQRLEESHIDQVLMKFQNILHEKDTRIDALEAENHSLQQITRQQTKYLEKTEKKKIETGKTDDVYNQDRQISILMEHVKKLNGKITELRKEERELHSCNEKYKTKNSRLRKKVKKLTNMLELSKLDNCRTQINGDILDQVHSMKLEPSIDEPAVVAESTKSKAAMLEESKRIISRQKDMIANLEKSLQVQRVGFLKEISSIKNEMLSSVEEQRKLEKELAKRELIERNQVLAVIHLVTVLLISYPI